MGGTQAILQEIEIKYGLTNDESMFILNEAICTVYNLSIPPILEKDGLYAAYANETTMELDFVKIKYSKKNINKIVDLIQVLSNNLYLKKKKQLLEQYLKAKRNYLYSQYEYSEENRDYYSLYYDYAKKRKIVQIEASTICSKSKKERIYVLAKNAQIRNGRVVFFEDKNFINIYNVKNFTKDIAKEVYLKIKKKIWIEIDGLDKDNKIVYVYLPYKNVLPIIEYIELRLFEVFGLKMEVIYKNNG